MDGNKVKIEDQASNKIINNNIDDGNPSDVYSFSANHKRDNWADIYGLISRNEKGVYSAKLPKQSPIQPAKSVRYVVEKLDGNSVIENKFSIVNIYVGKMP